jgi:hypothetical protein
MFQLTAREKREVVANCDHLGKMRYSNTLPLAFTEHGAIMAANVLNSAQAIEMGVFVVRAFVHLRRAAGIHRELAQRLNELEARLCGHDSQLAVIIRAIRSLAGQGDSPNRRRIGFKADAADSED